MAHFDRQEKNVRTLGVSRAQGGWAAAERSAAEDQQMQMANTSGFKLYKLQASSFY
jgi:hypothetical protein